MAQRSVMTGWLELPAFVLQHCRNVSITNNLIEYKQQFGRSMRKYVAGFICLSNASWFGIILIAPNYEFLSKRWSRLRDVPPVGRIRRYSHHAGMKRSTVYQSTCLAEQSIYRNSVILYMEMQGLTPGKEISGSPPDEEGGISGKVTIKRRKQMS